MSWGHKWPEIVVGMGWGGAVENQASPITIHLVIKSLYTQLPILNQFLNDL